MLFLEDNSKSLTDHVADQLISFIQKNHLSSGDKLPNEFELAEQLNVGRGTVREAVKLLISRNILEIQRGKGTFVAENTGISQDPLGLSFLEDQNKVNRDLIEVRLLIEPPIVSMAAHFATAEDIEEMHHICDEIEALMRADKNYLQLDVALHTAFARSTKNSVVPNMIPIITQGVSMNIEHTNRAFWRETMEDHRAIVTAIETRDPQQASDAMVRHLLTTNKEDMTKVYVDTRYIGTHLHDADLELF